MFTENPLVLIPGLTGFIFVLAGFIMFKFPPKKINHFYGYRTKSSMKNKQRWDFAQTYAAKQLMKFGAILFLSGFLGFYVTAFKTGLIMGFSFMLVAIVLIFLTVEGAIKIRFDKSEENVASKNTKPKKQSN